MPISFKQEPKESLPPKPLLSKSEMQEVPRMGRNAKKKIQPKLTLGRLDIDRMDPEAKAYRQKNQQRWLDNMKARAEREAAEARRCSVLLHLEPEIIEWFRKKHGPSWKQKANEALMDLIHG